MFRCPHCGGANQPAAPFCINCGEPLDEESLAEFAVSGVRSGASAGTHREKKQLGERESDGVLSRLFQGRRLELWLGLALVIAVIGFVLWSYVNQERVSAHYRAGQDAYERGEYRVAVSEFSQADGYLESDRRIDDSNHQLDILAGFYREVEQEASEGRWWEVAHTIVSQPRLEQNYSDISALLAKARSINGKIVYRPDRLRSPGKGVYGLYVAEADGGNAQYVTSTNFQSDVLAISPQDKWLVYTNPGDSSSNSASKPNEPKVYLYDMSGNLAYELMVPDKPSHSTWARFLDEQTFIVGDYAHVSTFSIGGQVNAPLAPTGTETADAYERREYRSLLLATDGQGNTTLSAAEYDGANPRIVAVEQGSIDGALVSKDSRFVVYRVCAAAGTQGAMNCALKYANLKLPTIEARLISTIPLRRKNDPANSVTGEFTEDGNHLLVLERYDGTTEAHLLNLENQQWVKLPGGILNTGTEGEVINPLMPDYSSGLRFWQGPNSLTHTSSAIEVEPTLPGYGKHSLVYETLSHRLTISPDGKYALYYIPHKAGSDEITAMYEARLAQLSPLDRQRNATQPSTLVGVVPDWQVGAVSFLADGITLLATNYQTNPTFPAATGSQVIMQSHFSIAAFRLDTAESIGEITNPDITSLTLLTDNHRGP